MVRGTSAASSATVAVAAVDRRERPIDPAPTQGVLGVAYEAVMIALAITVIALIVQPDRGLIRGVNLAIWGVFVADYTTRLALSGDRRSFVRRNLIDLVAIIPLDFLRAARALKIVRVLRLLRAASALWRTSVAIRGVMGTNALGWVLAASGTVVILGAGAVMLAEPGVENFGDALWWSIVTSTTVGYGDIAPESVFGRAVAVALMVVGIGTIGMITGSVATYFLGSNDGPSNPHVAHLRRLLDDWEELSTEHRLQAAALMTSLAEQADHSTPASPPEHRAPTQATGTTTT
jgi:voltage-gated potassium channel